MTEINGMDRRFADGTGKCVVPGIQTDGSVYGCIQEGKF